MKKVLQITNLGSDKSKKKKKELQARNSLIYFVCIGCQYSLQINVTNNQAQTYTGTMTRIAQKMSAAYPETASLSL